MGPEEHRAERGEPGDPAALADRLFRDTTGALELRALIASLVYEYLYLRPLAPPVVGTPESGVAEPRPGDTASS